MFKNTFLENLTDNMNLHMGSTFRSREIRKGVKIFYSNLSLIFVFVVRTSEHSALLLTNINLGYAMQNTRLASDDVE